MSKIVNFLLDDDKTLTMPNGETHKPTTIKDGGQGHPGYIFFV